MATQFTLQSLSPELIFTVMSFLDSFSVFRMERLNTKFHKSLTTNKLVDRWIYGGLIMNDLNLLPCIWRKSSRDVIEKFYVEDVEWKNWLNEKTLLDLLVDQEHNKFRKLLRDFYLNPFRVEQGNSESRYSSEAYRNYFTVGGVVEFTKWKPCALICKILQNFTTSELLQSRIQLVLLFMSVNDWIPTNNLGDRFRLVSKGNQTSIKLPGEFLMNMIENKMSNVVTILWNQQDSAISYNLFCDDRGSYKHCNFVTIFVKTKSPPYGMRANSSSVVEALQEELFETDSTSIDWGSTIGRPPWSSYWNSGLEWWGCYAMTTFNSKECAFIVSTASCTD